MRLFHSCGIGLKHRCLFHVLFIVCLICNSHFKSRVILPEGTFLVSQIHETVSVLVGVAFKHPLLNIKLPVSLWSLLTVETSLQDPLEEPGWLCGNDVGKLLLQLCFFCRTTPEKFRMQTDFRSNHRN